MSIKITRTGSGLYNLGQEINRVRKFGPFLKEIGQSMVASTKLRFNKGIDPEGNPWEPSQRVIRQGQGRTLVLTGRLQKSIEYSSDESEVSWGTDVPYGEKHQEGDGVPQRQFLGISNDDEKEIERIVEKHIEG